MLSKLAPYLAVFLFLVQGGCAGPHALRNSRAKYAAAVQVTRNEQLLLNLVRLRYRDTPSFLELSNLATQFSFDESAGIAGTVNESSRNFNVLGLSAGIDVSERPTASYTPLQGAEFVTKLITPIEEETIVLLTRSGWKGERVFRIAVQSINGLANMRGASGPTPTELRKAEIDETLTFRELVKNLEKYSDNRIVRFNYESVEVPKSAPIEKSTLTPKHAVQAASNGFKIVHKHDQVAIDIDKIRSVSSVAEDYLDEDLLDNLIASVKQDGLPRPIRVKHTGADNQDGEPPFIVVDDDLLFIAAKKINKDARKDLAATERGDYQFDFVPCDVIDPNHVIVAGTSEKLVMTWDADNNTLVRELGLPNLGQTAEGRYVLHVEPRSLMGAMYYLSHAIRVPLEHQAAGLVVTTLDGLGNPFDWTEISGDLLYVESSKQKPECAAVAVKYRGHWFYIDDRDHSSKATFALLMQLFELRASGGAVQGPVLTLPVGI